MTTTEITASTDRVSLPALLADLVLFQVRENLPEPVSVAARAHISQVVVELASRADVDEWFYIVGGRNVTTVQLESGAVLHTNMYGADRCGWTLCLTATVPAPIAAGTLAELAGVTR